MTTILQWEGPRHLLTTLIRVLTTIGSGWCLLQGAFLVVYSITGPNGYIESYPGIDLPFGYAIWVYLFPWIMLFSSGAMLGLVIWQSIDDEPPPQRARWKPFYPLLLLLAFIVVWNLNSWMAERWFWWYTD